MAITIKTLEDIEKLKIGGERLSSILTRLEKEVVPGVSTDTLNTMAEEMVNEYGDTNAFKGYRPEGAARPFPSSLIVSINDEIVHGISNENPTIIKDGDVVSIDMGIKHDGMIVDSARTVIAGKGDKQKSNLLTATYEALHAGIAAARGGGDVGDIGFSIQNIARKYKVGIAEGLAGHGVGYEVHEDPYIPNKGKRGTGDKLVPGMVIAIEPMFTTGKGAIVLGDDGYTYSTVDGSLAAHFEHTVLITEGDPIILTAE
jgi:methionyl aminopeptidase